MWLSHCSACQIKAVSCRFKTATERKKWAKAPITMEMSTLARIWRWGLTDSSSSPTGNQCLCTLWTQCSRFFFSRAQQTNILPRFPSTHCRAKTTTVSSDWLRWMLADGCVQSKPRGKEGSFFFFFFFWPLPTEQLPLSHRSHFWCISVSSATHNWTVSFPDPFTLINQSSIDTNLPHLPEQRVTHTLCFYISPSGSVFLFFTG